MLQHNSNIKCVSYWKQNLYTLFILLSAIHLLKKRIMSNALIDQEKNSRSEINKAIAQAIID